MSFTTRRDLSVRAFHNSEIRAHMLITSRSNWKSWVCLVAAAVRDGRGRLEPLEARPRNGVQQLPAEAQQPPRHLHICFYNFCSNFWLIFGKLWEVLSRLYRRQNLQVNTCLKALDEIYKIDTLLHRSAFKHSAISRQAFSHFHSPSLKFSLILSKTLSKIHELWWKFSGISAFFAEKSNIC